MLMSCTALMCVEVTAIVPPRQQALLRTAGSVAAAAYTAVVEQGRSTIWVEFTTNTVDDDEIQYAPITLPAIPLGDRITTILPGYAVVLVVTHAYLQQRPSIALTDIPPVHPITCVRYVGGPAVTEVGRPTLANDRLYGVTKIELRGFEAVHTIGFDFMARCESLKSIDLSPLHNATIIHDRFLGECTSLASIDLSPLHNVKEVGGTFLFGCKSLTTIDLSPLHNLTSLSYSFLSVCTTLQSPVDISPFRNVQSIGSCFMAHCTSITAINITPFSNVTRIGDYFMTSCSALTTIDLEPLRGSLLEFGDSFLEGCSSLSTIKLDPINGVTLTGAGERLLARCGRVKIVDQGQLGDVLNHALRGRSSWKCVIETTRQLLSF